MKERLLNNEIIIMPSDTVWGIFAIISKENQDRINRIKNAPADKKISIMFANEEQAKAYIDQVHHSKLSELREGKTYILKTSELLKDILSYDTVGVRIVPEFEELIKIVGPLFTTSANLHGELTPETKTELEEIFENIYIVDGVQKMNKPSSIISFIEDDRGKVIR